MKRWAALLGIGALAVQAAQAAERSLLVQDLTVLQDGTGQARLLFRTPEIAPGERIIVSDAKLVVPLTGLPMARNLRLWVYPVTRAWSAGAATWTTPWSRGGGDVDDDVHMPVDVDLRGRFAVLDLTGIVKEAVEEGRPMYGFLVTRDPAEGVGIPLVDAARFTGLGTARMSVSYLHASPRPRRR